MLTKPNPTAPPSHLGVGGRRLWNAVQSEYGISDGAGLELLRAAAEARDRLDDAGAAVRKHGAVIEGEDGKPRANPACAIERDARSGMLAALKGLHLDIEPLQSIPGRPPGSYAKRR
jgi:P27 family predicted phage terminase small subunit